MRPPSIRARLALWYGAALAVSLALVAGAGYAFVARSSLSSTDASLAEALDAVGSAVDLEAGERRPPAAYLGRIAQDFRFRDMKVAIMDRRTGRAYFGAESAQSGSAVATDTPVSPGAALARSRVPIASDELRRLMREATGPDESAHTSSGAGEQVRVLIRPHRRGSLDLVLVAAHGLQARARVLHALALAMAAGMPLLLLAAMAGGWLLARQSLHPVAVMTELAARIGAATLHERLPVRNPRDELGRLATVFNALLARLDEAFELQRRFMADASHELRTPVAIVSGEAELAISRDDRSPAALRAALVTIRQEGRQLKRIVDDLFLLARANAGEQLLAPESLYLSDIARECVQSARSLAAVSGITLHYEGTEELPFTGDEALLRRLVMNLLDNAIKYTQYGGEVTLQVGCAASTYTIEVRDTGPGIPPEAWPRLFDRFYRARPERGPEQGGSGAGAGLGLAIARWIAESHGGTIALAHSDPRGSTFRVTLPAPSTELGGALSPQADVSRGGDVVRGA